MMPILEMVSEIVGKGVLDPWWENRVRILKKYLKRIETTELNPEFEVVQRPHFLIFAQKDLFMWRGRDPT